MAREFFKNLPNTTTPITAPRMNALLDGDEPMGNVVVDSIKGKNVFNINNLSLENVHGTSSINYADGTIKMTDLAHTSKQTLKELCPTMKVGETYTLSFAKQPDTTNNYIYLDSSAYTWNNGTSKTITQTDLDGIVYFYGGAYQTTTEYTMSQIQIEKGTNATSYTPYQNLSNNPYVLYDNANGSISTIQLNDNVTNYNYIEILFEAEDIYNSTKLYSANGKYVYLSIDVVTNTNNYFKNSSWLISGNSISFQTANQYNISSSGVGNFVSSTNAVKIHRVIGYK